MKSDMIIKKSLIICFLLGLSFNGMAQSDHTGIYSSKNKHTYYKGTTLKLKDGGLYYISAKNELMLYEGTGRYVFVKDTLHLNYNAAFGQKLMKSSGSSISQLRLKRFVLKGGRLFKVDSFGQYAGVKLFKNRKNGVNLQLSWSDLFLKIDSIIKYELKYQPQLDGGISLIEVSHGKNAKITISPKYDGVSFSPFPFPLIILDDRPVKMIDLDELTLKMIVSIEVMKVDNQEAVAIYGTRATNGVIIIKTRRSCYR